MAYGFDGLGGCLSGLLFKGGCCGGKQNARGPLNGCCLYSSLPIIMNHCLTTLMFGTCLLSFCLSEFEICL